MTHFSVFGLARDSQSNLPCQRTNGSGLTTSQTLSFDPEPNQCTNYLVFALACFFLNIKIDWVVYQFAEEDPMDRAQGA